MLKPIEHFIAPVSCGNLLKKTVVTSLMISCGFAATVNAKPVDVKNKPVKEVAFADKKIHFNGITLTPGGYIDASFFWRSHLNQTDVSTQFNAIPYNNATLAHMQEVRFSARRTRLNMLIQGNYAPQTVMSGFVEIDFLAAGRANSNQSNTFEPRMRHIYSTLDVLDAGWHMLAGQSWTLANQNKKGIIPRTELNPITIDGNNAVGYLSKRNPQLRITKNWGETLWAAMSIENPQTTFGSPLNGGTLGTPPTVVAIPVNGVITETISAPGIGALSPSSNFSLNHIPDVIGKLAFDPTWFSNPLHLEVFGMYRDFYNRVQIGPLDATAANSTFHNINHSGGGVGGSIYWEAMPRALDLQANIFGGRGIGSYFYGQLPDVTLAGDGGLAPISEIGYMVGAIAHATPALDVYVYGGAEGQKARYFATNVEGTTFGGFGVPLNINNTGCEFEGGTCTGLTKTLWQINVGFWDKLYNGNAGQLLLGLQYSYIKREAFPGYLNGVYTAGTLTDALYDANANQSNVFVSIRYLPFTAPTVDAVYNK